jgi:hypothetical protein
MQRAAGRMQDTYGLPVLIEQLDIGNRHVLIEQLDIGNRQD